MPKPKREIGVTVTYPATEEGLAELQKRIIRFNGDLVVAAVDSFPVPRSEKLRFLAEIAETGTVPWA